MHYDFVGRWLLWLGWIVLGAGVTAFIFVWRHFGYAFRLKHVLGIGLLVQKTVIAVLVTGGLIAIVSAFFGNFFSIDITENGVVLDYAWPRQKVVLQYSERIDFRIVPFGNGKRCVLKVIADDDVYTSEAILRGEGENLLRQIQKHTQR